jgi:hypothetical protein
MKTTKFALHDFAEVDKDYHKCWERLGQLKYAAE